MVHWGWLIVASICSGSVGFILACLFAVNANNSYDYETWTDHTR